MWVAVADILDHKLVLLIALVRFVLNEARNNLIHNFVLRGIILSLLVLLIGLASQTNVALIIVRLSTFNVFVEDELELIV